MTSTLGPERKMWPHNSEDEATPETIFVSVLPPGGEPGQVLAINERREYVWIDPPEAVTRYSESGVISSSEIPPLDESHLPDLSGKYQSVEHRNTPGGYPTLDKNGKLSPYVIPTLVKGLQGERGTTGSRGEKGEKGERGEKGDVGFQGANGRPGEQGPQGVQGARGVPPDMKDFVKRPSSVPTLSLGAETLAQDLAYLIAELGLVRLV